MILTPLILAGVVLATLCCLLLLSLLGLTLLSLPFLAWRRHCQSAQQRSSARVPSQPPVIPASSSLPVSSPSPSPCPSNLSHAGVRDLIHSGLWP